MYTFQVVAELNVVQDLSGIANHAGSKLQLNISSNLDKMAYFNQDGTMTKDGFMVSTDAMVQCIIGNIHAAHQSGDVDSAKHLRHVISELERGFVAQITIQTPADLNSKKEP